MDVLAQLKTARFDRALSYEVPAAIDIALGDVVRVPLGSREVFGFVVTQPHAVELPPPHLRQIIAKADVPRAFDELGFGLATWVAERYVCSLREALGAVMLGGGLPRAVDRYILGQRPMAQDERSVPARLIEFIWTDCPTGFTLNALLRHPEVRRVGDRQTVLRHVQRLVRAGALARTRRFEAARVSAVVVRFLVPGTASVTGKQAAALRALVVGRGEIARSEALLAGYSNSVIRRAIAAGAIVETQRRASVQRTTRSVLPQFVISAEQRIAIDEIDARVQARTFAQVLLHGVTGSGKTLIYLATIARVLAADGRAIVLVPEISLTPQTARRFEEAFGERVAVLHSALSDRERFDAWQAAARGEVDVIVGARSAVFSPLVDVRLIIVDEAHETSYKQDVVPRYSALDVARERMRRSGGVVVLGSATPSIEDYARARAGKFPLITLRQRATAQPLPRVHVVDMSAEFGAGNRRIFSTGLLEALEERLQRREKTVLFVNRRGTAKFLLCRACGHVPQCTRCSVTLTVHRAEGLLRCHYCDAQHSLPQTCSHCASGPIREFGIGTQRIVHEVEALFPSATVVRMDSDTTTRIGDHARLLDRFAGAGDILVGTQMVAKGLDFPQVTLVGAVAADLDLHVADFRAAERTFGLLTQVCGRSGRSRPGEAFIQTYTPQHPAIRFVATHDYDTFANLELAERRAAGWPPFARLVYLGFIGRVRADVEAAAQTFAAGLRGDERWTVLGPAPYPIARLNEEWRYRLAIKTRALRELRETLRQRLAAAQTRRVRIAVNVDP